MMVETPIEIFLSEMSYLMKINKICFPFEIYCSVSILLFFVFINVMQNVLLFFHYFRVSKMADRSQTSTGLSVYVYDGLHKVLTLPATAKINSVMFL